MGRNCVAAVHKYYHWRVSMVKVAETCGASIDVTVPLANDLAVVLVRSRHYNILSACKRRMMCSVLKQNRSENIRQWGKTP